MFETDFNKILDELKVLISNNNKAIIVIEGASCSGKTTLVNKLKKYLDFNIVHMDDFYLPNGRFIKIENNYDGNFDYRRFKDEIINNLNKDKIKYGIFSCKKQIIEEYIEFNNNLPLIIEGSYSLHPILNKYYDFSIYLDIDENIQIERIKNREKENAHFFLNKWKKLEDQYHLHYKIKNKADLTIYIKK